MMKVRNSTEHQVRLRQALIALVLAVPLVFLLSTAEAGWRNPKSVSTLTTEGRLAVFDDAWQTINDRYYDPKFNGLDWEAQRTIFRPLAAEAANGQELYAVLRRLVGGLNDVHTRVHAPEEKFDWWNPRFVSIGLTVREVEGLPTVVHVDKGSAPQRAGIRPGDVIEKVNGTAALSLVDQRLSRQPEFATRPSARFRAFASVLEGPAQTSLELFWRTRNGRLRHARFERQVRARELGVRVRRERGKYIVAEIDAFTPTIALNFTRAINRNLAGAQGIVLDLRGNGGGEAEAMADVASTFLGADVSLGTFTDRWGISFNIRTRSKSLLAPDLLTQTKLPLVVLIGERTSSAAEIFVASLQSAKRATILGTESCGCVLAIRNPHTLPDGGVLDVSELGFETSQGLRLEQNSIKPDGLIVLRRQDVYAGRDHAMERALKKLAGGR